MTKEEGAGKVGREGSSAATKKQPEQQQQCGQDQKNEGKCFRLVGKMKQQKEELKLILAALNWMKKRMVTHKKDNRLPHSQKKDFDISSEVNGALFEAKALHFVCIQGVTNNTKGF